MQKILLTIAQASLLHGARAFVWTCGVCVGHSAASSRQLLVSRGLSFEISSGPSISAGGDGGIFAGFSL